MFRSSENLRLAADMRALQRVAAPWRQARTSWFDGTPESIEARLAATERVLSYAKGGMTPAHMQLEREAAAARTELLAAKHRLLTDFLDDGARAFRGSRRVAGEPVVDLHSNGGDTGSSASLRHRDDKENNRYTIREIPGAGPDGPSRAIVNHDSSELMSADGMHHWASYHTASQAPEGDENWETFDVPGYRWLKDKGEQAVNRFVDYLSRPLDDSKDKHISSLHTAGRHDTDPREPLRNTVHDDPYRGLLPGPEDFDSLPEGVVHPSVTDDDYQGRHRSRGIVSGSGEYPLGPGYDRPGFGPDDIAEHDDYLHRHDYHTERPPTGSLVKDFPDELMY